MLILVCILFREIFSVWFVFLDTNQFSPPSLVVLDEKGSALKQFAVQLSERIGPGSFARVQEDFYVKFKQIPVPSPAYWVASR